MMIRIRSSLGTWRIQLKQFAVPTLLDVKNTIFNEYQIPLENQSLTLDIEGNQVIQPDNETLQALGIKNGDLLFLSGRLEKQVINKSYVGENGNVVAAGVKIQLKSEIDQKDSEGLKISKRVVDGDDEKAPNHTMESDIKKSTKLHQRDEKKVSVEKDNKQFKEGKEEPPKINNEVDVGGWEYYDTDDKNSFNSPDVRAPDAVKVSNLMYDDDDNDNMDMEFDSHPFRFGGARRHHEDEYITKLPDNMNSEAMAEAIAAGIPEHELLMDLLTSNHTTTTANTSTTNTRDRHPQRNLSDSNINNFYNNNNNANNIYQEFDNYIDSRSRDNVLNDINNEFSIPMDYLPPGHHVTSSTTGTTTTRDSSSSYSIRYDHGRPIRSTGTTHDDDMIDFDSIDNQILQLAIAESEAMNNALLTNNTSTSSSPLPGNHTNTTNTLYNAVDDDDNDNNNNIEEDHELRMLGLSPEEILAQKEAMLALLNEKNEKRQRRNELTETDHRITPTSTSRVNSNSSTSSDHRSVPLRHHAATSSSSSSSSASNAATATVSSAAVTNSQSTSGHHHLQQPQEKRVTSTTDRDLPMSVTGTSSNLLATAGRRSLQDSSSLSSIPARNTTTTTSIYDTENNVPRKNNDRKDSYSNNNNNINNSLSRRVTPPAVAAAPSSSIKAASVSRSQSTGHRRKSSSCTSTSTPSTHPRQVTKSSFTTTTTPTTAPAPSYNSQQMEDYLRQESAFYDLNNNNVGMATTNRITTTTTTTTPTIRTSNSSGSSSNSNKIQAPLRPPRNFNITSNTTSTTTASQYNNNNNNNNNNINNDKDVNTNTKNKNKSYTQMDEKPKNTNNINKNNKNSNTNTTTTNSNNNDDTKDDEAFAKLLAEIDEEEYNEFLQSTRSKSRSRSNSEDVPLVNSSSNRRKSSHHNISPDDLGDREQTFGDVYAPRVPAFSSQQNANYNTPTMAANTTTTTRDYTNNNRSKYPSSSSSSSSSYNHPTHHRPVVVDADETYQYPRPNGPKPYNNTNNKHNEQLDRQRHRNSNDSLYPPDMTDYVTANPPSEIRGGRPYYPENYGGDGNRYHFTDPFLSNNNSNRNHRTTATTSTTRYTPRTVGNTHRNIEDDEDDEDEALARALSLSLQTK